MINTDVSSVNIKQKTPKHLERFLLKSQQKDADAAAVVAKTS